MNVLEAPSLASVPWEHMDSETSGETETQRAEGLKVFDGEC